MALTKPDLRVANRVFTALKALKLPQGMVTDLYINGRERGYHVTNGRVAASFSENRNSDQIVIYRGPAHDFDFAGRPSDQAWIDREYFAPGAEKQAAHAIAKFLNRSVK